MKKFLLLFIFFTLLPFAAQGSVLTIDTEPAEFTLLKQNYNEQKKAAVTPKQYKKLQKDYEKDTKKILKSSTYMRQKNAIESAQAQEIQQIEKRYQAKLAKLQNKAVFMVDRKYKVLLDNHKQSSQKAIQSQYIINLKRLEDKLIRSGDLGGALVVQTERKKAMQNSQSTISGISEKKVAQKPKVAPAKAKIAPTAPKKKAVPPTVKTPASAPHVYSSDKRGFAGSGKTSQANAYTFNIKPTDNGAELVFQAYGRKSNDSYGEVFLTTPDGKKHQVANWSPDQLKKASFYDVAEAKHVEPIIADISEHVVKPGNYTVEFVYRDGNEALIIYKTGITTK